MTSTVLPCWFILLSKRRHTYDILVQRGPVAINDIKVYHKNLTYSMKLHSTRLHIMDISTVGTQAGVTALNLVSTGYTS